MNKLKHTRKAIDNLGAEIAWIKSKILETVSNINNKSLSKEQIRDIVFKLYKEIK